MYINHCVKSVRVRIFSGPYFPVFGLKISPYSLNARKYGVEKLRIRMLFTQCRLSLLSEVYPVDVPYILGNSVFLYLCNYLISINEISPQRLFDIESFQV